MKPLMQSGSAWHALWIDEAHGPSPPSGSSWESSRQLLQFVSGFCGVEAHAVAAQIDWQPPVALHPHWSRAVTNVW